VPPRAKDSHQIFLTNAFGREHWIAKRFEVPFARVKYVIAEAELSEFAGSEFLTAEMMTDWPPTQSGDVGDRSKNRHHVVSTADASHRLRNSDNAKARAAARYLSSLAARRGRKAKACSFCGRCSDDVGPMLEADDALSTDRLVRVCQNCALVAILLAEENAGQGADE